MKEIDANWDIKCLETSCHILCKCKYFSTERAATYHNWKTEVNEICSKNMAHDLLKMVTFFHKTKVFKQPPKMTKNMISPRKNKSGINKRKSLADDPKNNPESKRKKDNTNNLLEKYYPIIID